MRASSSSDAAERESQGAGTPRTASSDLEQGLGRVNIASNSVIELTLGAWQGIVAHSVCLEYKDKEFKNRLMSQLGGGPSVLFPFFFKSTRRKVICSIGRLSDVQIFKRFLFRFALMLLVVE
jgi:hypothetical protein